MNMKLGFAPIAVAAGLMFAGLSASAEEKVDYKGMTANVLNQIGGNKDKATANDPQGTEAFVDSIASIVERAKAEGRGNAYIGDLISEASKDGSIVVPEGLKTESGEIDTATLLSIIVSRADTEEDAYGNALLAEASGKTGTNRERVPAEPQTHVVVAGDSLAGIALRYYNDALEYPRILAANSDKIVRADLILVGQRLTIPR